MFDLVAYLGSPFLSEEACLVLVHDLITNAHLLSCQAI